MISGPLPNKFTIPVGSSCMTVLDAKEILIESGYNQVDYLKYSKLPNSARYEYNNLFVLGYHSDQRKSVHHPLISPLKVFEKIEIPERNLVYSDEELNNLFKMLQSNDLNINKVALTICSKMNLSYIINTEMGEYLKYWYNKSTFREMNNPYVYLLLICVHNYGLPKSN